MDAAISILALCLSTLFAEITLAEHEKIKETLSSLLLICSGKYTNKYIIITTYY